MVRCEGIVSLAMPCFSCDYIELELELLRSFLFVNIYSFIIIIIFFSSFLCVYVGGGGEVRGGLSKASTCTLDSELVLYLVYYFVAYIYGRHTVYKYLVLGKRTL